jgi:hypothetical protein
MIVEMIDISLSQPRVAKGHFLLDPKNIICPLQNYHLFPYLCGPKIKGQNAYNSTVST